MCIKIIKYLSLKNFNPLNEKAVIYSFLTICGASFLVERYLNLSFLSWIRLTKCEICLDHKKWWVFLKFMLVTAECARVWSGWFITGVWLPISLLPPKLLKSWVVSYNLASEPLQTRTMSHDSLWRFCLLCSNPQSFFMIKVKKYILGWGRFAITAYLEADWR